MNIKVYITMALIYGLFFLISAAIAFALFKFLSSGAEARGTLFGVDFNVTGALAGFIVSFLVLHYAYSHSVPGPVSEVILSGNVSDAQDNPVKDAVVWVKGQSLGDTGTDTNGWFRIKLEGQPPWTVGARKKGYESGKIQIDADQTHKSAEIMLKKKLH
ncbi:MAG: carboxypeptidase-like regulatory domain-containing protein [Methylococcales bacterium]